MIPYSFYKIVRASLWSSRCTTNAKSDWPEAIPGCLHIHGTFRYILNGDVCNILLDFKSTFVYCFKLCHILPCVCVCVTNLCTVLLYLCNTHTIQLKSLDGCTVTVVGTETHHNALLETKQP